MNLFNERILKGDTQAYGKYYGLPLLSDEKEEFQYLPFLYILAFGLSFGFAILLDLHEYIVASTFVIFVCLTVLYNIYLLKGLNFKNEAYVYYNKLLSAVVDQRVEGLALFNNQGEIIYANQTIMELARLYQHEYHDIEAFLSGLNIPSANLHKIKDFISRKSVYNSLSQKDQSKRLIINNVMIGAQQYVLSLDLVDFKNIISCLAIYKVKQDYQLKFVEQLNIGFYELNKQGHLQKVNECFAKMLGYRNYELDNVGIPISQIINDESIVTSLNNNPINSKFLTENWQALTYFKTKYKETNKFFIVNKPCETGSIGFISKIKDNELLFKLDDIVYNWLDYSWKCLFKDSLYPFCVTDFEGKIIKVNESFIKYFHEQNVNTVLNKQFTHLFKDTKEEKSLATLMQTLAEHMMENHSAITLKVEGTQKVMEVIFNRITGGNDNFCGFLVNIVDVTRQSQLKESFAHTQRMQTIGHLVGSVAHDFNNILTAISGFSDLLLMRHGIGDPSFSDIMQIKQSADRASNLVQRLLAFSRKQVLKLQVINLAEFFSEISLLIQRLIGARVNFLQQISPDVHYVLVDVVQMQQVILNLVVNANHAMESGGNLTIKVENYNLTNIDEQLQEYHAPATEERPSPGKYIKITVEDTGCGISPDNIQKIFEPFFTTKDEKTGTGLGLSTVYGIVSQLGGFIYVKSQLKQGTTFVILLKQYEGEVVAKNSLLDMKDAADTNLEANLTGSGKIVIVEDEEAIRILVKNALTNKGYEVIEFDSSKTAIEELPKILDTIDLVISDVVMPQMSGPVFISQLKKIKPDIKVLFISGYAEENFAKEYGYKSDFHFIPKPFSLKQLIIKVQEIM